MSERPINTHDQLCVAVKARTIGKRQAVAVSYYARPTGRMGWGEVSRVKVWSPLFDTNPSTDVRWRDMGCQSFPVGFKRWREVIEDAKKWASEKYGIAAWSRNRMGDFVPAEVNKKHPIPKRETAVPKA